jgi:hypothetical protein
MNSVDSTSDVGDVKVHTTSGRGLNVEELADLALNKILHVADTAAPALKEQARLFKETIRVVLIRYMHQAIKSDRTTLYNQLRGAGNAEIAELILKI